MNTLNVKISGDKTGYYAVLEVENGMISGDGKTVEETKKSFEEGLQLFVENGAVAVSIQDDYNIIYEFDTTGLLKYLSDFISFAGLMKMTGIAQKQLWDYANGVRHPKPETSEKIMNGLSSFCKDLQAQLRF